MLNVVYIADSPIDFGVPQMPTSDLAFCLAMPVVFVGRLRQGTASEELRIRAHILATQCPCCQGLAMHM